MKTNSIQKVLIALDYYPTSQKVAEVGYSMAKALNAEATLLHVSVDLAIYSAAYANMGVWQMDTQNAIDAYEIASTSSQHFLEKAKRHLVDKSIQVIHKEGDAAQKILETAAEIKADCIVVGSHSQKWLENIIMGSVTEEVLRKTTIPMFIVPTKKRD